MSEINTLAHQIAFDAATTLIDCHTVTVQDNRVEWHDLDGEWDGKPLSIALKPELRYLTLRGALVWDSLRPNLVRFVAPDTKIGDRA